MTPIHPALFDAVIRQRNEALNHAAQAEASAAVLSAENERLAQRLAELEHQTPHQE